MAVRETYQHRLGRKPEGSWMNLSRLFFSLLISTVALANTPKVEKLAAALEDTKQAVVQEDVKQRKIMSSLFDINRKMKRIVTERSDLVQERMLLETTTSDLSRKISEIEEKLKSQKSFLRERLAFIYRFGGQGVFRTLFSSTSSAHLERNLKILGIVAKRDLELIKDYSGTVADLGKKKNRLQNRLEHLRQLEKNIRDKEEKLTLENGYKNRILDGIRKSKKFAMAKLQGLRAKSLQMAMNDDSGVFDLLFRPSFFEQKGELPKPLEGQIVQNFGLIRDEENNLTMSHKGLFISATSGAEIKSVFDGKVAFSGEIPGFGQTLVIDHGDHYYTVYGNNQEILVTEGEEVQQSQKIASVGRNFETQRSGLYFEIRHFSEPYDPRLWLKGSRQ